MTVADGGIACSERGGWEGANPPSSEAATVLLLPDNNLLGRALLVLHLLLVYHVESACASFKRIALKVW